MDDAEDVVMARADHMKLADTLWRSVNEPARPASASDREIFELLGRLTSDYSATLSRVEDYFDRLATKVWERLTSDAPVSRIRQTVWKARDRMRALMLSRLPADLRGARVLDAGRGAGQMTSELAARGADVVAVDISPALVDIARARLPAEHAQRVTFASGDMTADHGRFDYIMAMDSLIYYGTRDITAALHRLG